MYRAAIGDVSEPPRTMVVVTQIMLLSTVHLRSGERTVRPSHERVRCLLAMLACRSNELVPDDALVDGIWGDSPPAHPVDSLYTCALRLRRTLSAASYSGRVARSRGGYILEADPHTVDLSRFRRDVSRAHAAARAGQDHAADRLFEKAISLCTETPLADVRSDWAGRTRETLNRHRLSAQVAAAEVGLRLGRHLELLPSLEALSAAHPLDERIAGLLMVARYRAGGQAGALTCYAALRRRLVEELGSEPGPAVKELHEDILSSDAKQSPGQGVRLAQQRRVDPGPGQPPGRGATDDPRPEGEPRRMYGERPVMQPPVG